MPFHVKNPGFVYNLCGGICRSWQGNISSDDMDGRHMISTSPHSDIPPAPDALARLSMSLGEARRRFDLVRFGGRVVHASASGYRVSGLAKRARIGDCVELQSGSRTILGQVISISTSHAIVESFDIGASVGLGQTVWVRGSLAMAPSAAWKGRVIDALAQPIDQRGAIDMGTVQRPTEAIPTAPLLRQRVERAVRTGVKVIDIFTPICAGQRIGIFAGSGVGKSTLLGMMARSRGFDTTVVALVGERGREVREFIEDILGASRGKAVVVVATGDESPMMRRQAPRTAMTIAEYFRDQGQNVLLIVDSITRYAHAMREVALAAGEPPVARGYAPSVFTELPRLLERAGPGSDQQGTITGIFSVLVDGDDHNEPIADSVRGILDGHIVLDRDVATRGQFPAVDILRSVSRLAEKVWSPEESRMARQIKAMISEFEGNRELRLLGAYKPGSNSELDRAVALVPKIYDFLSQHPDAISDTDPFKSLAEALAG